jgi:hypothetical protein
MTAIARRLGRRATLAAALLTCCLPLTSALAAQDFTAAIEQDARTLIVRVVGCGPACKVMRFDDAEARNSMLIMVRAHEGGVMDGRFSFVDHAARKIDFLEFTDPAMADFVFGAQAARANALERLFDALRGRSDLQATGERRTFAVRTFDGESIDLDAEQYRFEFEYVTDVLPGMAQMSAEQRAQMPDIKLRLTMSGETWVAPGAPGADVIAQFYVVMGAALRQYTEMLAGGTGEQADMTAAMVSNMARIAALGLPVQTTTRTAMSPEVGGAGSAMAQMFMRMLRIPEPPPSTSRVVGLGIDAVTLGPDVPDAVKWGWRNGPPSDRSGYDAEGYAIRDLLNPGG